MNADIHTIITSQLRGEALKESHWLIWKAMGANPILMETLGGVWDESKAKEKFLINLAHWKTHGFGQWMFFHQVSNEFIGRCGLRYDAVEGKTVVELGYSVMPSFWRQGYATEMASKAIEIGKEFIGFKEIVAFTSVTNIASQNTILKLGFQFETHFIRENIEHYLYRKFF